MLGFSAAKAASGCIALLALTAAPLNALERHGVDTTTIDHSVKPDADFYQFANGKWLAHTTLPADRTSTGAFQEVNERNEAILHDILEKAAHDKNAPAGSLARKLGDFYRTGMDEALADKLGAQPLAPIFEQINAITDRDGILSEIARLHRIGIPAGFGIGIEPDPKNSRQMMFQIAQGGISLPDHDYYLKDDAKSKEIRALYAAHLTHVMSLLGDKQKVAAAEANTILALETRLAKGSLTRVELRNPNALYHKMTLTELKALTPDIAWDRYLAEIALPEPGDMNIGMPEFMKTFDKAIAEVPLADWKTYLRWQTVGGLSSFLSKPFLKEDFDFSSKLTGQKTQSPRWRRVMNMTDGALGEALGQLYVARAFTPEAKSRALSLVTNIKAALRDRLQTLDWMTDTTKEQALRKLDAMQIKIGYPDKWEDYSGLTVGTDSYVQNVLRVSEFAFKRQLAKNGKPVDRTEWAMTPPTVNAYYNPLFNEIVFPAGILQPPFFDAKADDASNYGAIGMVIGHEMTHGFDDQGRQFDADGNLKDWWTPADAKRFSERGQALAKQYEKYVAVDKVFLNGQLTLGENISDLGGLNLAYQAWCKTEQGKQKSAKMDGFTAQQRFFLAFAQIWRFKTTPQFAQMLAALDAHSPGRWRVLGTLVNVPAFVEAFGPGDSQSVARPGSGSVSIW